MKILLFGISNVGKTTCGKLLAKKINYKFFDMDEEIKKHYNTTLEKFTNSSTLDDKDRKRADLAKKIIKHNDDFVLAVSPISYFVFFKEIITMPDVFAIELIDSPEHIFDRLVFSDENDVVYEDRAYCEKYKKYYLREIHKNIVWYEKAYQSIKNKYFMDGKKPEEVVSDLIDQFQIRTFK